jgi:hypothetical protein
MIIVTFCRAQTVFEIDQKFAIFPKSAICKIEIYLQTFCAIEKNAVL